MVKTKKAAKKGWAVLGITSEKDVKAIEELAK